MSEKHLRMNEDVGPNSAYEEVSLRTDNVKEIKGNSKKGNQNMLIPYFKVIE